MLEVDFDSWPRKEHFNFFRRNDLPFYNVNFSIDVTGLKEYTKAYDLSLNNTLIFLTTKAVNNIENFHYRLMNEKVVKYDLIHPSFACIRGDEELFRLITVEFNQDIVRFNEIVKEAIDSSKSYFELSMLSGRSDFVFISSIPWIPFTGVDHTLSLNKDDSIPRISWGKIYKDSNKSILPYNIQVNHIFIDGLHVGKFYESLQEEIRRQLDIRLTIAST